MNLLHIAKHHPIYNTQDVEGALSRAEKITDGKPTPLTRLYEHMVQVGPLRFASCPCGNGFVNDLELEFPNFSEVADELRAHIRLGMAANDLKLPPMLLLGNPGVGKTYFAERLAAELGTVFVPISMAQATAGWMLSGASSQWSHSKPGKVFEALVEDDFADPVFLVDEIDKAGGDPRYDPLAPFHDLLEPRTAKRFVDEYAEVPVDASRAVWIATANELGTISKPLQSRLMIFEIRDPTKEEKRMMVERMFERALKNPWGHELDSSLPDATIDVLLQFEPRTANKLIPSACGRALDAGRRAVLPEDVRVPRAKPAMGFTA